MNRIRCGQCYTYQYWTVRARVVNEHLQGPAGLRRTPEAAECVKGWEHGPPAWLQRHEVTAGLATGAVPCWTTACTGAV